MMDSNCCTLVGLFTVASVKALFLALSRSNKLKKFEEVGKVSAITLFPLKSGGPVHLKSARCTRTGLRHDGVFDRHWMVIRSNGHLFHARTHPKMVLIRPSTDANNLILDAPGMPTLKLPKQPQIDKTSKWIKCRIWNDDAMGLWCGPEADQWIRQYIDEDGLSIVVSAGGKKSKRDMGDRPRKWDNEAKYGDLMAFPDNCSYMIASESSLADLNTKLEKKLSMLNFRPNITIKGDTKAFDEDSWSEIRIGDTVYFRMVDKCDRCSFPNIDPASGIKDPKEPLKTLKECRFDKAYGGPTFGVNGVVDLEGEITVGDSVYVLWK